MAKINLYLAAIDHETKVPLPEALAAIDNGVCDGKKTKVHAALTARPARRLTTKGLKNGTYMVPTPEAAADLGFTEIKVKWSWNAKAKARVPYVSLDGEYTPASNPARRRAVTLVTEGIAVKVDGPVAEDDSVI
jgi:hypothetical protein